MSGIPRLRMFAGPNGSGKSTINEAACLRFSDDKLSFFEVSVNSYFASVAADFSWP